MSLLRLRLMFNKAFEDIKDWHNDLDEERATHAIDVIYYTAKQYNCSNALAYCLLRY